MLPPPPDAPLISVIVPIFDVEDHVGACIDSLRTQTHSAIEVLMIDDGSRDESAARARDAAGDDPRFRLITQPNAGLSAARNRGLEAATGDYVAFVDSDDTLHPDFLAALLAALEAHPDIPWAACAIRNCLPDGSSHVHTAIHDAPDTVLAPGTQVYTFRNALDVIRHYPSAWNKLYRRTFIGDLRFATGTWFEDHAFYLALAARTDRLLHLADPLYEQTRGRAGQITETDDDRIFDQITVLEDILPLLEDGPRPDGTEAATVLACRLLSERSLALHDPVRRAAFVAQAQTILAARQMTYTPDPQQGISAAWGLALDGILPLSVLLSWDGREVAALTESLAALAQQATPGFELLILCPTARAVRRARAVATNTYGDGVAPWGRILHMPGTDPGTDRAAGLAQAQGRFVTWMDAGDRPDRWALFDRVEALLTTGAECSLSAHFKAEGGAVNAGFETHYIPAHNDAPVPVRPTPRQALAADLTLAGAMFDRVFLQDHGLRPAACARHGGWPIVLGALLLCETAVYLPRPDVTLSGARARRYPIRRLARDHRALCAAMPAVAVHVLPRGWERRLLARMLRAWLLEGRARGRIGQGLALLSAALLIAQRGMGRTHRAWPAGFDAQIGPKFARLFDSAGLVRLALPRERARITSGETLPGDAKAPALAVRDLYPEMPAHAFPLDGTTRAQARFVVSFDQHPFANIHFYAGDGRAIPLHISLRQDAGLIVCNDTRTDGLWRQERRRARTLPRNGVTLAIEIAPAAGRTAVRLWLDGTLAWTLGTRSLTRRAGLTRLDMITHLALEGGLTPLDLSPDGPASALRLDRRLELRLPGDVAQDAHLQIEGTDDTISLRMAETGARATLPARAWSGLGPSDALVLRLSAPESTDQILTLSRADLATRISTLLRHGLPMGDAHLILHLIEHVALGDLSPYLDAEAQAELARLIQRFDLGHMLPDLHPRLPHRADPFGYVAADLVARARRGGPVETLVQDLPTDPAAARHLLRLLVEQAVREDRMEALHGAARAAGLLPLTIDGEDIWTLSASLPFLWLDDREPAVLETLQKVTRPGRGWRVTPALAWIGARAQAPDALHLSAEGRLKTLEILLDWLAEEAADYWGRTSCQSLIRWAAGLVRDLPGLPAPLQDRAVQRLLAAYGTHRPFWEALAAQDGPLPPPLALARDAFARLEATADPDAQAAALAELHRLGAGGTARARIEYLGPAGAALPADHALAPADLLPLADRGEKAMAQAALRHMAMPGTAPATDAVADMVATALRHMAPEQTPPPYAPLQREAHAQITALLADPDSAAAALPALLDTLARLGTEGARYLGLGLAMTLLPALPDATARRATADWLIAQDRPDPNDPRQEVGYWRRRAPAVRMGLTRLAGSDLPEAADVLARYTGMPAGTTDASAAARTLPPLPAPGGTGALPPPHPLNDVLVMVLSCRPYLDTRVPALRASWLADLEAMGIPYLFVVGNGDNTLDGDVLHLDAPDDYEGLPAKTLAAIDWVRHNTTHAHMFKIDDDCLVDPRHLFDDLSYRACDYMGRKLYRVPGQMDRTWHQAKASSPRGRLELDKSPEPSTYADGGSGYLLSRDAMEAACAAADSPEGRSLIDASFMEDKLLGDLLTLAGIPLSTPGYLTSIRRRTFPDATPVAYWNVGFHPSRAAPTQQVHLDTHLGHDAVRALRDTNRLAPRKIWPSYQPPKLGYQSNALELLSPEDTVARARTAPVAVVAVMRNERFMLPHFLAHYRGLGVESFLIADNVSDDGSREYLLDQDDVALFSVDTDYGEAQYGVAWQQALMAAFRMGRWSVVADADELLVWQAKQTQTLTDLLQSPDFAGADAARIFMLDMYPQGALETVTFADASPFEAAGFADRVPFAKNPLTRGPFSNQTLWTSALRHRLIPGTRPDLFAAQKIALLKYHPSMRLSAGLHFVSGTCRAPRDLIFGHFKYTADFYNKARAEVARKQHFNDAEEYRKYLALAAEGRAVIFDPDLSLPWTQVPFVQARLTP